MEHEDDLDDLYAYYEEQDTERALEEWAEWRMFGDC